MREDVLSLQGIRTPEHMKVCARPLKRSCFEWNTFQFIRFPVYRQKLSYNCLDSILMYHNRLFQNISKITCIGQNPRQNHVTFMENTIPECIVSSKENSQMSADKKININYTYLLHFESIGWEKNPLYLNCTGN